jgi:hypothetical protein
MHRKNRSRAGRWRALAGVALLPVLFGGCETMSHTDRGVLTGGALGTGLGAAVGSMTGHTGAGAALGGITGAVTGGAIGSGQDRMERRRDARLAQIEAEAAAARAQPALTLEEIRNMAHRGTGDQIIINQIRATRSVYHLTAEQITWLQEQGVSEGVIGEMQQTALRSPAPAAVVRQPVIYQPVVRPVRPVYVVEPYYPYYRPPPVGIGFTFTNGRGCRHW